MTNSIHILNLLLIAHLLKRMVKSKSIKLVTELEQLLPNDVAHRWKNYLFVETVLFDLASDLPSRKGRHGI